MQHYQAIKKKKGIDTQTMIESQTNYPERNQTKKNISLENANWSIMTASSDWQVIKTRQIEKEEL